VTHFGFQNNDANVGWTERTWSAYSQFNKKTADEGINMVVRFNTLDPGASVSFTWAYILSALDLVSALTAIKTITIVQPTDTASGSACIFGANVDGTASLVEFYVSLGSTSTKVGSMTTPTVAASTGGGLYQLTFSTLSFASQDGYSFVVIATVGTNKIQSSKIVRIDNTGPTMALSISPAVSPPFVMDNMNTFTLTATYVSGPAAVKVSFYRELALSSSLLTTDTTAPFSTSVSAVGLAVYSLITLKAVASAAGGQQSVSTLSGVVKEPNLAPTDITFSAAYAGPSIPENSPASLTVATLGAVDPNSGDAFTYAVVTAAPFTVGTGTNVLTVASGATLDFEGGPKTYTFSVRVTDVGGLTFTKSFTVSVTNVNEAPTSISLSPSTVVENSVVGTVIGTLSTSDLESSSGFTYSLASSASGAVYLDTATSTIRVAKVIDFEAASSLSVSVTSTDPGGLSLTAIVTITVTNVNEAPTLITLSNAKVNVRWR
jgi:hypothetical protein